MSNWCDCDLTVSAKTSNGVKQLDAFVSFAGCGNEVIDTNKFVPYPEKFRKLDEAAREARERGDFSVKDGFNSGGYDWCTRYWGTKWGICDSELVDEEDKTTTYHFRTAWNPPLPVVKKMSKKFPALEFELKYYEGGEGFQGIFVCRGGKVLKNKVWSYSGHRGG